MPKLLHYDILTKLIFNYSSIWATANISMLLPLILKITCIIHATLELEVIVLIAMLRKMNTKITSMLPITIKI